jgi:hypothetical protein
MVTVAWVGTVPLEATQPTVAETEAHHIAFTRLARLSYQYGIPRQNLTTAVADTVMVWIPEQNLVQDVQPHQPTALSEPALPKKRTKKIHEIRVLDPPLSDTDLRLFDANDLEYTNGFGCCARTIRDHFEDVDEEGVHHRNHPGKGKPGLTTTCGLKGGMCISTSRTGGLSWGSGRSRRCEKTDRRPLSFEPGSHLFLRGASADAAPTPHNISP